MALALAELRQTWEALWKSDRVTKKLSTLAGKAGDFTLVRDTTQEYETECVTVTTKNATERTKGEREPAVVTMDLVTMTRPSRTYVKSGIYFKVPPEPVLFEALVSFILWTAHAVAKKHPEAEIWVGVLATPRCDELRSTLRRPACSPHKGCRVEVRGLSSNSGNVAALRQVGAFKPPTGEEILNNRPALAALLLLADRGGPQADDVLVGAALNLLLLQDASPGGAGWIRKRVEESKTQGLWLEHLCPPKYHHGHQGVNEVILDCPLLFALEQKKRMAKRCGGCRDDLDQQRRALQQIVTTREYHDTSIGADCSHVWLDIMSVLQHVSKELETPYEEKASHQGLAPACDSQTKAPTGLYFCRLCTPAHVFWYAVTIEYFCGAQQRRAMFLSSYGKKYTFAQAMCQPEPNKKLDPDVERVLAQWYRGRWLEPAETTRFENAVLCLDHYAWNAKRCKPGPPLKQVKKCEKVRDAQLEQHKTYARQWSELYHKFTTEYFGVADPTTSSELYSSSASAFWQAPAVPEFVNMLRSTQLAQA